LVVIANSNEKAAENKKDSNANMKFSKKVMIINRAVILKPSTGIGKEWKISA